MVTPTTAGPVSGIPASGDDDIDPLLLGRKWGGPLGTAADVTYSFPGDNSVFSTSTSGGYGPTNGGGEPWDDDARGLDATQKQYFREAMNAWAEVADINGREVADNASTVGDIRVAFTGNVADQGANVIGYAYYPAPVPIGGDIWLNPQMSYFDNPAPGGVGFHAYLHEIGHALGLAHPFDGTGAGVLSGVENTHQYTVMAYARHPGADGYALTPMLYDIQAIQYLYGANTATRAGDTTYSFAANAETVMTIWDGGGNDTLDAANQTLAADISLIAGGFSSIGAQKYGGAAVNNVAIAFNVVIENAKGGSGDDRITGNDADNRLEGGGGGDTLIGGAGNDVLDGDGGDDWAVFSGDFGAYAVTATGSGGVTLRFTGGGAQDDGTDQVFDVEHFVFADGTKTLAGLLDQPVIPDPPPPPDPPIPPGDTPDGGSPTIEGTEGNDTLDGTGGDDVIAGYGGNDVLKGRSGDDVVRGDAGNDKLSGNGGNDLVIGGDGNDTAWGNHGADTLYGGAGDDTLNGGEKDDVLDGGAGNDLLNGGAGDDRALFSGVRADYDVSSYGGDGATLVYTGPGGPGDGADRTSDVEWFQFQDATLSLAELLSGDPGTPPPPPPPPANGDPNAADDTATTAEDQSVTIAVRANDTDPDGDALSISAVTQGASGQVTVNADGTVTYTPDADFNGNDGFTYTIADGRGGGDTATVTVTVDPVNDAPVAVDDDASTDQGQSLILSPLANDSDPDGDPLQVVAVTGASGGGIQINADGTVTYTPDAGFTGVDTLTYTVRDPGGAQDSATITIRVDPVDPVGEPDPPPPDNDDPPATLTGTEGGDNLTGTASDDVIDGLGGDDVLQGRAGNDVIRGGAGDDKIWGDYKGKNSAPSGDDTLIGGDGNDSILGQKGNDVISGGAGDDTLKGQAGGDEIDGGAGDDSIHGGGGGDRFVFAAGFGNDTIADFGRGADTLDLTAFAIAGFAAIDDDGDGRIETGEGGAAFTATIGSNTVLDFGNGNVLTLQGAATLDADAFELG